MKRTDGRRRKHPERIERHCRERARRSDQSKWNALPPCENGRRHVGLSSRSGSRNAVKVIQELPPNDRPRVEKALRKIGVHPLREALRQRLTRAREAPAPISDQAAPSEEAAEEGTASGTDVDQAIDLLNGASSVLSAFGGRGGMPSRVSSTPMSVVRQAPAAAYHPTPHQRGSDITGIGSH